MVFLVIESLKNESLYAVRVGVKDGEKARKVLIKHNLLLKNFEIIKEDDFLFFPIKDDYFKFALIEWKIETKEFKQRQVNDTLHQQLEKVLPAEYHMLIPSSYDMIGEILLIKLSDELLDFKKRIGEVLLKKFKKKSVFTKISDVSTIYRTIKWNCIAGVDDSFTIHKMNNLRLAVNINEVYFNPRFATEYIRIADKCQDNWNVIDLFAGIGPFSLTAACLKKLNVYSCDINPKAINLFNKNLELNKNKIHGRIMIFQGDAGEVMMKHNFPKADLIFMNLPEQGINYLELAISKLKSTGKIILYQFIRFKDKSNPKEIDSHQKKLRNKLLKYQKIDNLQFSSFTVEYRILREVSPSKSHIVWEISSNNQ